MADILKPEIDLERVCAREGCAEMFSPGNKWWRLYCSKRCGDLVRVGRKRKKERARLNGRELPVNG